jgi:hypothetical protein
MYNWVRLVLVGAYWVNTCHLLSYFKKKLYQFSGYSKFSVDIQLATWEVFMLVKSLQFSIYVKILCHLSNEHAHCISLCQELT